MMIVFLLQEKKRNKSCSAHDKYLVAKFK